MTAPPQKALCSEVSGCMLFILGEFWMVAIDSWRGPVLALLAHRGVDVALWLAQGLQFRRGMDCIHELPFP